MSNGKTKKLKHKKKIDLIVFVHSKIRTIHICSFDMRNNTKHWMASDLGEQASFSVNRTGKVFREIRFYLFDKKLLVHIF